MHDDVPVDRDRDRLGRASLGGYALFQHSSPDVVAFVLALAAGAILTMLADTMMPEAYQHAGKWVGVLTALDSRSPSRSTFWIEFCSQAPIFTRSE